MSKQSFFLICALCVLCGSGSAQTLTQISDTLYNADGTKASGRIVISWDPFTTSGNVTVDGGTKTYTIPASGVSAGVVDVSLYPNAGATPTGTSYRVRYYLANGASYVETWVVPATGPVTIAGVRVLPPLPQPQAAWLTQLNGLTATTQTFTSPDDTNVLLTINSTGSNHAFTMGWSGLLGLARGGTNQSAWTASRCVRVNNAGTSLESASADCGAGGGGGHTLQEEGSNLPQQAGLNFIGAALTAADDAANSRTNVTLSQSPASASVVGTGRAINTSSPLSGGGDLTSDRTLSCPTCEVTGNKNAASGYAGLTASTKLNASQGQEVWALTDLSDVAITTPASAQTVRYSGSSWVNAALAFADLSGSATAGQVPNLENLNGTLDLASGGTNQTAWTASRCVRVNTAGTALESAAADCGSGGGNHNLLSTTHSDTTAGAVARGDLVVGQGATPTWQRLALGLSGRYLRSDGTDAAWATIPAGDLPSTVVRTDQSNTYSGTTTQDFGGSGITLVAPKKVDPGSPTAGEIWINSANLKYRDNQGTPATQTVEIQSNKNAASGYAGLTASTKLTASQGQEVWGLGDLSDVSGTSGSGSTAVLATMTSLATNDVLHWAGSNWVNGTSVAKADALTTNPADCSANNFANAIAANGDLTCAQFLATSGTAGTGPSKVGTGTTAARSDHDHRSIHSVTWYFAGTPGTGVPNLTLTFPEVAVNYSILDMRVTVNTTSASSSTFNIQRCTASCTGTSPTFANIYSANLTLSASTRTVAKAAAPDQNVTGLAAGDQFKTNLVTIGASLADVTITMTYKYDTTN